MTEGKAGLAGQDSIEMKGGCDDDDAVVVVVVVLVED